MNYDKRTNSMLRLHIAKLKREMKNLKPEDSGQVSEYYMPAIYYLEEELKRREEG